MTVSQPPTGSSANDSGLFCLRCNHTHSGKTETTFLGLRGFTCGECGHRNKFPPPFKFTICTWIYVLVFSAICLSLLFKGSEVPIARRQGALSLEEGTRFVVSKGILMLPFAAFVAALSSISEGWVAKRKVLASRQFFSQKTIRAQGEE